MVNYLGKQAEDFFSPYIFDICGKYFPVVLVLSVYVEAVLLRTVFLFYFGGAYLSVRNCSLTKKSEQKRFVL